MNLYKIGIWKGKMEMQNNSKYEEIEKILYSYSKLTAEIENIKIDIEEINDCIGMKGKSECPRAGSNTYAFTSAVENEVFSYYEELQNLEHKIRTNERLIKKVDNALKILTEDERNIIRLRYFEGNSIERIADIMLISSKTVTRNKKKAIIKLMDVI